MSKGADRLGRILIYLLLGVVLIFVLLLGMGYLVRQCDGGLRDEGSVKERSSGEVDAPLRLGGGGPDGTDVAVADLSVDEGSGTDGTQDASGVGGAGSSVPLGSEFLGQDLDGLVALEEPLYFSGHASRSGAVRVERAGYLLSFSPERRLANWVAYELEAEELERVVDRYPGYVSDDDLEPWVLESEDYRGSGFSRGHLAPSADMRYSEAAQRDAARMGNMCPQYQGFNGGVWNNLEDGVRGWARSHGSIYVVTGPAYMWEVDDHFVDGVAVPSHYFKALMVKHRAGWHGIGFLVEHSPEGGSYWEDAVTLDSLQRAVELDFFPLLPDSVEVAMEAGYDAQFWGMPRRYW